MRIALILCALVLAACTPVLQIEPGDTYKPQAAQLTAEQPQRYWWQLSFKLEWPADEGPDFSRHALIAEQLLRPAIVVHQQQLGLWRFHRRAGRDSTGHQFSLIFLTDEATATQINEDVRANPLADWLVAREMVEKINFYQRSPEELGRLELTSDPSWPIEIQRAWPYFIMGASQSWLMLVGELSSENSLPEKVDYQALLTHYQQVDERMNTQWRDFGQHAYLHHLSAIFGYQPLRIRSNDLRTF
jgi:hypothetical protein